MKACACRSSRATGWCFNTDGIIEATVTDGQGGGEEFGLSRLKEFARANPASLADRLIAAVSGTIREDDLTVVVAEACSL